MEKTNKTPKRRAHQHTTKKVISHQRRRPKNINQWSEEKMKHAVEECRRGDGSINHAAREWCLPRSTLQLRVNGKVEGFRRVSGRKPIISSAAVDELATLLVDLARRGFPLSGKLVRDVAYQYAQENKLAGFSQTKGTAGYDWLNSFMKRHPNLAVRKPEALSAPGASSVNPTIIG